MRTLLRRLFCLHLGPWVVEIDTPPKTTSRGLIYLWRCRRCDKRKWFQMQRPPRRS